MAASIVEQKGLAINALKQKFRNLTAIRAVNYLKYSFNAGLEEIEMNGVASTPIMLLSDLPGLQTVPACEVAPLSFWGGPPGKREWYDGSLLTMLMDAILCSMDAGNERMFYRFMNVDV